MSLPEVAGTAALIVDPTNSSEFAAAIDTVLTSRNTEKSMVEKGLARVGDFTWSRSAEKLAGLISSVVNT